MTRTEQLPPIVVVVDDEEDNVLLVERTLRSRYRVHGFTDPQEALQDPSLNHAYSVVVDYRMPKMTGVELAQKIRQRGLTPGIVMVTAFPELDEVVYCAQVRLFYRLIPKPFAPSYLLQEVEASVANALMLQAMQVQRVAQDIIPKTGRAPDEEDEEGGNKGQAP